MLKKVISLFLVLCILLSLVGCGGGNPVVPPIDEESGEDEDIIYVQNTNPGNNVLAVAGKDEGEALAILGEKDAFGNPIKITGAVYTSEQGEAFIIDAGDDGLPTYILDSTGNKVVFTNYTDSTVEISIYNSNNELIEGPTTITVDPADLAELKQLYSSVDLKNKDAADVVAFVLKWGGFGLNWATCVVAAFSLVVPAIVFACGSAVLSTVAMFTPNDTDNLILSNIGVIQCAFAFKPWEIVACAGSIMSFIGTIIENINQDNDENENHPPVISGLSANPSSVDISQTTTITCIASDSDGDSLTYHWTKNAGSFEGSTPGSSVTWKASSTPDTYTIECEVSDGEGGEDSDSINIIVTEPSSVSVSNKVFLQSGGNLNGTSIDPSNPTLTVNTGESISGILNVQATYSGTSGNVVPFGYTPSWGSHSSSYVTVKSDLPVGTSTYNVSIDLNAPTTSGTYYLIFASNCEMNLGWTMSQTNWTTGTMSWNDGNDIADLTESNLDDSLSTGYLSLDMLVGSSYQTSTYGIAYVKIIVTEGGSDNGTYDRLPAPTLYDPGDSVNSKTYYELSWSDESNNYGATEYYIHEDTTPTFDSSNFKWYSTNSTSRIFYKDVDSDTTYYYNVFYWSDTYERLSKHSNTVDIIVKKVTEDNDTYTITASAGSHGSISPSGSVTVNEGSDKSFTITPDTGYQTDDVLVDGSSVGAVSSYTFTNVTQDHTLYATFIIEENGTYDLRDIGPAGGYIFYDKGYYSSGWRYLEAAPASAEWTTKQWGSHGIFIGGTEAGIGTGQSNTTIIVTWLNNHSETDRAAQLCDALVYGGYSDWFLPSRMELNLIYENLHLFGVGGFADDYYWSSSEYSANLAYLQAFSNGGYGNFYKYGTHRVRAVRAF